MDNNEFYAIKKPLTNLYKNIFGYEPSIKDFSCTREEYIEALNKSIKTKTELKKIIAYNDK